VLGIVTPSVTSIVLQTQTEGQKIVPGDSKEDPKPEDKTPPIISIENLPGGDGTDNNPGQWEVFAYDEESGIDEETINVSIDGVLMGDSFGIYEVPSSLGDHCILVEVMNGNEKKPLLGSSSNIVSIIDDDLAPPELSDLTIDCNMECVMISLTAIDYSGIEECKILINEEEITPLNNEENGNHFNFILENHWIFERGIYNVEIQAQDADNDRENDALSSSIFGTFEIRFEDSYQFVIWNIEELKIFVDSVLESSCLKCCLHWLMSRAQENLNDAFLHFEEGNIDCSLFYDLKAIILMCLVKEIVERTDKLSEDDSNFIIDELHGIKEYIVDMMAEKAELLM